MEAVDTVSSMEQKKDLTELFLEDFEVQQQFPLGKQSKEELKKRSPVVFSLYTLDFIICHLVIGERLGMVEDDINGPFVRTQHCGSVARCLGLQSRLVGGWTPPG